MRVPKISFKIPLAVFELLQQKENTNKIADMIKETTPSKEIDEEDRPEGAVRPFVLNPLENVLSDDELDTADISGKIPILTYIKSDPFKISLESTSPTQKISQRFRKQFSETEVYSTDKLPDDSVCEQIQRLMEDHPL